MDNLRRIISSKSALFIFPLCWVLFFFLLKEHHWVQQLENATIDWRFQYRSKLDPPAHPEVLIIGVDEKSLETWGRWPWPRYIHADFLQLLQAIDPSVVCFDILFTEQSQDQNSDAKFARIASSTKNLISGAAAYSTSSELKPERTSNPIGKTKPLLNINGDFTKIKTGNHYLLPYNKSIDEESKKMVPGLLENSYFGFVNTPPSSSDGVRRAIPMLIAMNGKAYPSLSLQALILHWNIPEEKIVIDLGESIKLPKPNGEILEIPIDERGFLIINYKKDSSFSYIGYSELVYLLHKHINYGIDWPTNVPPLRGKILLIGQTAAGLTDFGPNPLHPHSPLVLTHANAINSILQNSFLRTFSDAFLLILFLPVLVLSTWLCHYKEVFVSIFCFLAIFAISAILILFLFVSKDYLIPFAWPFLTLASNAISVFMFRWVKDFQSKIKIQQVFSAYVTPQVIEQLNNTESVDMGGESREVTIFFSDIRSFTTISETMDEKELVDRLNEYFERMVNSIKKHHGTLHKYIGDAVMAVWGDVVSVSPQEDAKNAVYACLDMRKELHRLNSEWRMKNLPSFHMGMGLNHGRVLAGNIGAAMRREFTVIGDSVNLASRIEGLTKYFKTDFLIGEAVFQLVHPWFTIRPVGLIQVKGKTVPVKIYEVMGAKSDPTIPHKWVSQYNQGFELYLKQQFAEAEEIFHYCSRSRSHDICSLRYLAECGKLIYEGVDSNWNGVIEMDSK